MTIDGYDGYGGGIAYDSIYSIEVYADYKPIAYEDVIEGLLLEKLLKNNRY